MFIGCILIFPLQYQCPDFVDIIHAGGDQITDGQWDRSNLMDRKSEMIANTKVCKLFVISSLYFAQFENNFSLNSLIKVQIIFSC